MNLVARNLHEHEIARAQLRTRHSAKSLTKELAHFRSMVAAQPIVAPHARRLDTERLDRDPHAIEPFGASALQPKRRTDERSRPLGKIQFYWHR